LSGDDRVGILDASQILQWKIGLIHTFPVEPNTVWPSYPIAADFNNDGNLGTLDSADILRWKVRLIPAFTCDTNGDEFGPEAAKRLAARALTETAPTARLRLVTERHADGTLTVRVEMDDALELRG